MKSRIPKIWLSLVVAVSIRYGTTQAVRMDAFTKLGTIVLFYANVPARVCDAMTNLKMLPERMNPTCSECDQF